MIAAPAVAWKLKSIGAITAIVPATRIQNGRMSQDSPLPYIAIDNPPGQENIGAHAQGQGAFRKTPLVVYCYAKSLEQATAIAILVEANLAPPSGFNASVSWNGTSIDHCSLGNSYEHIEDPQDGGEGGKRSVAVPVTVFHLNCTS